MKKILLVLLSIIALANCKKTDEPQAQDSSPFATNLIGKWEWVKTITTNKEITPQTAGYVENLSYGNDGGFGGNYIRIAQNGTPTQTLYQNNNFGSTDLATQSLISQFGNQYIKFTLIKSSNSTYQELIASDLVNDYSKGFGSTQHYYRRVGAPDKP